MTLGCGAGGPVVPDTVSVLPVVGTGVDPIRDRQRRVVGYRLAIAADLTHVWPSDGDRTRHAIDSTLGGFLRTPRGLADDPADEDAGQIGNTLVK